MAQTRSRRRLGLAALALLALLAAWWFLQAPATVVSQEVPTPAATAAPRPAPASVSAAPAAAGPSATPAPPDDPEEPEPTEPDTLQCDVTVHGRPPDRSRTVERVAGPNPENVWAKIRTPNGTSGTVGLLDTDGLQLKTRGFEIVGGTILADGYVPAEFVVQDGACQPIELLPAARVEGVVTRLDGREAGIRGCGGEAGVEADGPFVLDATPGACTVHVLVFEGGLGIPGPEVAIEPGLDIVVHVDLDAPDLAVP